MMIKYRLHEVAKDFNVSNKEIIEILQKHFGETKKAMTALEENELNVIFEHFTQENQVESFDEYLAANRERLEEKTEETVEEKPKKDSVAPEAKKQEEKPAQKSPKPSSVEKMPKEAEAAKAARCGKTARQKAGKQNPGEKPAEAVSAPPAGVKAVSSGCCSRCHNTGG